MKPGFPKRKPGFGHEQLARLWERRRLISDWGLVGLRGGGYDQRWNPLWISRDLCGVRYGNLCVDPTNVSKEVWSVRLRVYPLRFASPAQHNPGHRLPPESLGFRTSVPGRHLRRFLL